MNSAYDYVNPDPGSSSPKALALFQGEGFTTQSRDSLRRRFQTALTDLIVHNFPSAWIHKTSSYSNLAYPLSGKYIRVIFKSGAVQWHAIAAGPHESQANVDGLLSHGLLWKEYTQEKKCQSVARLALIAPLGKTLVLKSRLAWISGAGREVLLMEMDPDRSSLGFVDLADCGNLDTALTFVRHSDALPNQSNQQHASRSTELMLQEMLRSDIGKIDPLLDRRFVYPQVPAFLAGNRGMIDILTVTKQGRLAILELKINEDIELPLQGLDYWARVKWHHERGEFQKNGYFSGLVLSPRPPLLYFVCPQFRYHDSFPKIVKYLVPAVSFCQIGINENWEQGVKVLRKRSFNLHAS